MEYVELDPYGLFYFNSDSTQPAVNTKSLLSAFTDNIDNRLKLNSQEGILTVFEANVVDNIIIYLEEVKLTLWKANTVIVTIFYSDGTNSVIGTKVSNFMDYSASTSGVDSIYVGLGLSLFEGQNGKKNANVKLHANT